MGIHGSACQKPFHESDPPQILFVSSGGWGEEYNKVRRESSHRKSRIFKWNVAKPFAEVACEQAQTVSLFTGYCRGERSYATRSFRDSFRGLN